MIKRPPHEKQWLSWLYVVSWTLIIFVTIPLARSIQQYVSQKWNRDIFTYAVLAILILGFAAAIIYARRNPLSSHRNYFWLGAIAGIFIAYTIVLGKQSPEEAIHFVQYGVLGILVYRALTHQLPDVSIYFAAVFTCGIIGTIDEFIQWLTPRRVWGLKDIWLNFLSSALVQIAIAKGLQPTYINRRYSRANLRFLCRLAIAAFAIFGVSLLATPPRVAWVAEQISWLRFLQYHDSVLFEYGYRYEDPNIGVFRSRFSPGELKQMDLKRAAEAAKILNQFLDENTYPAFLSRYTPMTDPFVHEARVHLFRRDRSFNTALQYPYPKVRARHFTIAMRENFILEKYFYNTLQHSDYIWTDEKKTLAQGHHLQDEFYDSSVSRNLVTQVRERHIVSLFIVLILGLSAFYWYIAKIPENETSP